MAAATAQNRPPMVPPHYQQRGYSDPAEDVDVEQLLAHDLAMPGASDDAPAMHDSGFNALSASAQQHYSSQQQQQQQQGGGGGASSSSHQQQYGLADPNRAQNVALKVQLAASERELAQCRHALDLALVKSGNWSGMKHRVQMAKPLNPAPLKQWGAGSGGGHSNNAQQQHSSESSRASFVISSLQSQLREKEELLNRANDTIQEMSVQLKKQQQQHAAASASGPSSSGPFAGAAAGAGGAGAGAGGGLGEVIPGQQEATSAMTAHLMAQMRFLHSEVERYERALREQRDTDSRDAVDRGTKMAHELQQRDSKIATLSTQLANLKSKLTPLQKAALNNTKEGECSPMELLTRIGQLEHDLGNAVAARNDALNDKYALQAKARKLEERLREQRTKEEDIHSSAVGEVMASAQQTAKIREELARVARERDNLHAMVEMRRAKDASKRLASSCVQTEETVLVESVMQTDPTERPKVSAFCQVEAMDSGASSSSSVPFPPLHFLPPGTSANMTPAQTIPVQQQQHQHHSAGARSSSSSGNDTTSAGTTASSSNSDANSLAHALELKCAELDNVRARLEEQALQLERSNLALKQTRDTLNAEIDVRKNIDSESERSKAQVRTLQQTVSQLHVLLRDRDAALEGAQERADAAHTDSVKLAAERQNWQKQLAANAHDMEQLMAQNTTAAQQVGHAGSENEALREEVSRLLQREAQLSHALRAKDSELAEILASYQQCVQENEAMGQTAKSLDRECQNLKSAIQMREERIVELQREVQNLHQREEQLTTDLQACDYENGLLQRRIVQAETQQQSMGASTQELEQQIVTQRRVVSEFERAQAELHKQLIFKDNEALLLRKRCEQVEHECTVLTTQHNVEKHKLRELEDANARLQVSGLMSQLASSPTAQAAESRAREVSKSRQSMDELAQRNGFLARQLEVKDGSIAQLQGQIAEERRNVEMLRAALSEKAVQLDQCVRSMDELKKLVSEQARTLAEHASHAGMSDSEQY